MDANHATRSMHATTGDMLAKTIDWLIGIEFLAQHVQ